MKNRQNLWGVIIFMSFISVGLIWCRHNVVQASFELGRMQVKQKQLRDRETKLRAKLSKLQSPDRLKAIGLAHGLREPARNQVLFVVDKNEFRDPSREADVKIAQLEKK